MSIDYGKESQRLKALGHPVRLRMVQGLLGHECNVNKMVKALGLPQSTVSQHLGILKSRGIVEIRKEGVKTCYRVTDVRVVELMKVLSK
jgi:ArsR family transcriptional regulator, arsenate/arsenite/antimonite-responsive transcriptional repressor